MAERSLSDKRRMLRRLESLHAKYARHVNQQFDDAHRQYQLASQVHSESRQELGALFSLIHDLKCSIIDDVIKGGEECS